MTQHQPSNPRTPNDADLLFYELLDKHQRWILSLAASILRNPHDAEDVAQDVLLKLREAVEKNSVNENCSGWIREVTLNHCRKLIRRLEMCRVQPLNEELLDCLVAKKELLAENIETYRMLLKEIENLPKQQRLAIMLTAGNGMSYKEASQLMGCSSQVVANYRNIAKRKLQEKLGVDFN